MDPFLTLRELSDAYITRSIGALELHRREKPNNWYSEFVGRKGLKIAAAQWDNSHFPVRLRSATSRATTDFPAETFVDT